MASPDWQPDHGDDRIIGRAFKISLYVFALLGVGIWAVLGFLQPRQAVQPEASSAAVTTAQTTQPAEGAPTAIRFHDITSASGLDFIHRNGAYGARLLPETMGGGVAFTDIDNDQDPDIVLVNSNFWPEHGDNAHIPVLGVYANNGRGQFSSVTAQLGLDISLYGMGIAAADYDNDGDIDIFLSALGPNKLLRNDDGHFIDVSDAAGVSGDDHAWSMGCTFVDYDLDGDLDLIVANYVQWNREIDLAVGYRLTGIGRAYGPPTNFAGTQSYLYRNDGNGGFSDVSASAGIHVLNPTTGMPEGKALGAIATDVDNDGYPDLIVANDTVRNFMFHNRGNGRFIESGITSGIGFSRDGQTTGAMGIDAAWYRNDTHLAIGITNFANEMTSLYVADKNSLLFNLKSTEFPPIF